MHQILLRFCRGRFIATYVRKALLSKTKQLKSCSRHVLNKSEKKIVAAHIMATNAEEITLKSLMGTAAQQLSTVTMTQS